MRRILVIKLGALGDFIHAFHAFAAIRAAHAADEVTLLTTAPFAALAKNAPWFDRVVLDSRPAWLNLAALHRTTRLIRSHDFVYDLQTSRRTGRYFRLAGRPAWSGVARGASHRQTNPDRDAMHTIERQRDQLLAAGITAFPQPDRSWLVAGGQLHGTQAPYALLMPGGGGVGRIKRWPAERYGAIAGWLRARGLNPVVVGGREEAGKAHAIMAQCPDTRDLTGRTSFADIAALAAGAAVALGNDTGPLHLAASVGAPSLALFSAASVVAQAAPRGPDGAWVPVLQVPDLDALSVEDVTLALRKVLETQHRPGAAIAPDPCREAGKTNRQSAAT